MAKQFLQPKKRGRPPTGQGKPVQVRLHKRLLASIDRWMKLNPTARSRPEAIRRLVELALSMGKKEK
jgi:hypothetical protein